VFVPIQLTIALMRLKFINTPDSFWNDNTSFTRQGS